MPYPFLKEDEIQSFTETQSTEDTTKEDLDDAEEQNTNIQEKAEEENKPDDMPEKDEEAGTSENGSSDGDLADLSGGGSEGGTDEKDTTKETSSDTASETDSSADDTDSSGTGGSAAGGDEEKDSKGSENSLRYDILNSGANHAFDHLSARDLRLSQISEKLKECSYEELSYADKIFLAGGDEGSELEDDELMFLPDTTISILRFIQNPLLDYETPAGTDDTSTGGCSGCEDAADAAIIDAEIAPSEGSGEETGPLGGNDNNAGGGDTGGDAFGGDDMGGGDDFGGMNEMQMLLYTMRYIQAKDYQQEHMLEIMSQQTVPGMEDVPHLHGEPIPAPILVILKAYVKLTLILAKLALQVLIKVAKYGRIVYLFARRNISNAVMKMETIHKLWKFKLSLHIDKINPDDLNEEEVEALPFDKWVEGCKIALTTHDMVSHAENLVFDRSEEEITPAIKQYLSKLDNEGIEIEVADCKVNMNEYLDSKKQSSVIDLGYTKQNIPNLMRYFGDIAKRFDARNAGVPLQKNLDACLGRITKETLDLGNALKSKKLSKDSEEYKKINMHLAASTIRLGFMTSCMDLTYKLIKLLVDDAQRVLGAYENAYDPKFITKA